MRSLPQSNIGALSAIPFLLSLLAFAGFVYASNLLLVSIEQEKPLPELAPGMPQADPEAGQRLTRELQKIMAKLHAKQETLEDLQAQRATLAERLRALQDLEKRVAQLRLSRSEREARMKKIQAEIEALKKAIGTVQRELDDTESVSVGQLVPSGSRRLAVFVECSATGVWLMPERNQLGPSAPASARKSFLTRANTTGYVVFLIRPDGYAAFERYREVLTTYNATAARPLDFGYEPVDADWRLVYPTT